MSFCFFFSSRRRHTRWTGDWSSDVCSSDLVGISTDVDAVLAIAMAKQADDRFASAGELADALSAAFRGALAKDLRDRSEERRVGKECRARWWPYYEKEKTWRWGDVGQVRRW